jgi:hypothetical protein
MKKIKKWAVFVGLPKWEWCKTNDVKPHIESIGEMYSYKIFPTRKAAKAEADKLDAANPAWHYIANPAWPDSVQTKPVK